MDNVYEDITFMVTNTEALANTSDAKSKLWRIVGYTEVDELEIGSLID